MASLYVRGTTLWLKYNYRGKIFRESLKLPDTRQGRDLAEIKRLEKETDIKKKIITTPPARITFSEATRKFLSHKAGDTKSLSNYIVSFNEFLKLKEDKYVGAYTERDFKDFRDHVKETRSHTTARTYLHHLRIFFRYLNLKVNPVITLKRVKKLPLFISITELKEINSNVSERHLRDLYLFAFYTGMRRSEIINIRVSSIDLIHNEITVRNYDEYNTKSKADRVINIHRKLIPKLGRLIKNKKPNDLLFPYLGDYISKKFKTALRKTDINSKVNFHTLRHSFASNLLRKGASIYAVKELMGHGSISTTEIYLHLVKKDLEKTINLLT